MEPPGVAIVVKVIWGHATLHVSYASPPRTFSIGESPSCDCLVPAELIGGASSLPIVLVGSGDPPSVALVVPAGASGEMEIGGETFALEDVVTAGAERPFRASSSEPTGGHLIALSRGTRARMEIGGERAGLVLEIAVAALDADLPRVRSRSRIDRGLALAFGVSLSFVLHASAVGSLAYHAPTLHDDDADGVASSGPDIFTLKTSDTRAEEEPLDDEDETTCPHHEIGISGTLRARDKKGMRYSVHGPSDNPDPHLARELATLEAASQFTGLGQPTPARGDTKAYTAVWGREDSLGNDDSPSARGRIWGDLVGDVYGYAALDVSHRHDEEPPPEVEAAEVVGIEGVIRSTVGRGRGVLPPGFDDGHARLAGMHVPLATRVWILASDGDRGGDRGDDRDHRAPESLRHALGRVRLCYEDGLRTNPSLAGRVDVKLVVDRKGVVTSVDDAGSDLPDRSVVACILHRLGDVSFGARSERGRTFVVPIVLESARRDQ